MLDDCRICSDIFPTMSDSLLSDDPFNSEQSLKLFEVIDELHSCGAKAYVDLPEVIGHYRLVADLQLIVLDCHRRRSVSREILFAPKPDRNPVSGSWPTMHKIPNANCVASHAWRIGCDQNLDRSLNTGVLPRHSRLRARRKVRQFSAGRRQFVGE